MTTRTEEDDHEDQAACTYCGGPLWAFTSVQLCHPWPMRGIDKRTIRSKKITIAAAETNLARPFCSKCQRRPIEISRTRDDVVQDLMRELLHRGMKPKELQEIIDGHVSAIDFLAAIHPKDGRQKEPQPRGQWPTQV